MVIVRFILASSIVPVIGPGLMFVILWASSIATKSQLAFTLNNFYQIGLTYSYAIYFIMVMPIFLVLITAKVKKKLYYCLGGALISPLIAIIEFAGNKSMSVISNHQDWQFFYAIAVAGSIIAIVFWFMVLWNPKLIL